MHRDTDLLAGLIPGAWEALPADVEVHHVVLRGDDSAESSQGVRRAREVLTEEERARADRFVLEHHRRRWTLCRGALRALLAERTGVPAGDIRFRTGPHGKPYLDGGESRLWFNVSHSDEHALIALSTRAELGVDLEMVSPGGERGVRGGGPPGRHPAAQDPAPTSRRRGGDGSWADAIAGRFFSPFEVERYEAVADAGERLRTFFRLWSCKEAYIKAIGLGLAAGLHNFDIDLAPGVPARLGAARAEAAGSGAWRLAELAGPAGFTAAVVFGM